MKKLFYAISIIIYLLLFSILYKNYSISNQEYYFKFQRINSLYIMIILGIKFITDILFFIKKDSKIFPKISNLYIFLLVLIWIFFIPNPKNEEKLLGNNLSAMLKLNQKIFYAFNKNKNILPNKKFFESLTKLDLDKTPYLKKGNKEYSYQIYIEYNDYPMLNSKGFPPGSFFIVISEKNNDFYITASILHPITKKLSMMAIKNETIVLNKNINIENINKTRANMEFVKELYINTKK